MHVRYEEMSWCRVKPGSNTVYIQGNNLCLILNINMAVSGSLLLYKVIIV